MSRCPLLLDTNAVLPNNLCSPQQNYCMHLGEFTDCDTFKRYSRMSNNFNNFMTTLCGRKNPGEENEKD